MRVAQLLLLVGAASFLLLGCVSVKPGPRTIEQITSSEQTVKLLYSQPLGDRVQRGLIECDRAANGALESCENVMITFNEEPKGAPQ